MHCDRIRLKDLPWITNEATLAIFYIFIFYLAFNFVLQVPFVFPSCFVVGSSFSQSI